MNKSWFLKYLLQNAGKFGKDFKPGYWLEPLKPSKEFDTHWHSFNLRDANDKMIGQLGTSWSPKEPSQIWVDTVAAHPPGKYAPEGVPNLIGPSATREFGRQLKSYYNEQYPGMNINEIGGWRVSGARAKSEMSAYQRDPWRNPVTLDEGMSDPFAPSGMKTIFRPAIAAPVAGAAAAGAATEPAEQPEPKMQSGGAVFSSHAQATFHKRLNGSIKKMADGGDTDDSNTWFDVGLPSERAGFNTATGAYDPSTSAFSQRPVTQDIPAADAAPQQSNIPPQANIDLSGHQRKFKDSLAAFQDTLRNKYGLETRIGELDRTAEKQAQYYAQGRTAPGPIVTYAKPWESRHNYGLAADLVPVNMSKSQAGTFMQNALTGNPNLGVRGVGSWDPFHVEYPISLGQLRQLRGY